MATNLNTSVGGKVEMWLLEKALGAMPAGAPNPSIERDVQGLSPLAAPHVKR